MASWQITPICDLETAVNRAPAAEWVLLCPPVHMEWLEWFAVVTNIPVQKLSCGSRSLVMVRHWFVCAEGKHAWQKKKKQPNLWRAQISFLFYLSSGPASCYALVCFWPRSSGLGMAAFPLAGICGINTKVIPTVSIRSDCSRQLLWYSNLRDSRTHLWVDVVAAICTNCII